MTFRIFISYRRSDSEEESAFLAQVLRRQFGDDHVFWDQSGSVELGRRWSSSIDDALREARVTLVVIGPQWLDVLTARTEDVAEDVVVREITHALDLLRSDGRRRVISVRVDGAELPSEDDLPPALRPLVTLQGTSVRRQDHKNGMVVGQVSDATIEGADKRLVDVLALARSLPVRTVRKRRTLAAAAVFGVLLVGTVGGVAAWPRPEPPQLPLTVGVTATTGTPNAQLDGLAEALDREIAARDASTQIGIRRPEDVARLDGESSDELMQAAAAMTNDDLQAVIAVVETENAVGLRQTGVDLYLAAGVSPLAPELTGRHVLLEPRDGDLTQPGIWRDIESAVRQRGGGLVDLLQALASIETGNLDAADSSLRAARVAVPDPGWRALIELFAGTVDVKRADASDDPALLQAALTHYNAALELSPSYERAILGRAQARYLLAVGTRCETGADVETLHSLVADLQPLRVNPHDPAADISYKAALLLGRVRTCLGIATREGTLGEARREFDYVIDAYRASRRPSLKETVHLAYLGRAFLYMSYGETSLAVADLDEAIVLTSNTVRRCDAYRLKRQALDPSNITSIDHVERLLDECPPGT